MVLSHLNFAGPERPANWGQQRAGRTLVYGSNLYELPTPSIERAETRSEALGCGGGSDHHARCGLRNVLVGPTRGNRGEGTRYGQEDDGFGRIDLGRGGAFKNHKRFVDLVFGSRNSDAFALHAAGSCVTRPNCPREVPWSELFPMPMSVPRHQLVRAKTRRAKIPPRTTEIHSI